MKTVTSFLVLLKAAVLLRLGADKKIEKTSCPVHFHKQFRNRALKVQMQIGFFFWLLF